MGKTEFKITEHIGTLSDGKVVTELNVVEWGRMKPTYDLRRWKLNEGDKVPCKGLTLSVDELRALREFLNEMEIQERR